MWHHNAGSDGCNTFRASASRLSLFISPDAMSCERGLRIPIYRNLAQRSRGDPRPSSTIQDVRVYHVSCSRRGGRAVPGSSVGNDTPAPARARVVAARGRDASGSARGTSRVASSPGPSGPLQDC